MLVRGVATPYDGQGLDAPSHWQPVDGPRHQVDQVSRWFQLDRAYQGCGFASRVLGFDRNESSVWPCGSYR